MAPSGTLPQIIVNAKVYAEVTGAKKALALAKACAKVAGDVPLALAPPLVDLAGLAASRVKVPLYGQHCDPHEPGAATGWITAEALQSAGATGSLLNHAEHKVPHAQVQATVARLHAAGLTSVVCADSLAEVRALAAFKPRMLAIEPPQLIGGGVSVTSAEPAIIRDAVAAAKAISPKTKVLCGAGVKTGDDVAMAVRLGAHGVLLASGVVKAKDPLASLRDLANGLA